MNVKASNDKQAIRYLLGELTEAEQARLEERFFHDSELSELLSEAEDDLIDQYVREELSGRERERFERHFLVSERRREKVEFSRALLQAERATTAVEVADTRKPLSSWKAMASALRAPRPALSYSLAAAALLFLLGGLWLFSEVRHLRREVAQMEAERETRERQNDQLSEEAMEQRRRSDELAAQKERLEQELALKQQADMPDNGTRPAPTPFAFILSPGYRGSEGPKNLILPRSVQTVRLQLKLNPGDEYRAYQVKLQTASGDVVRSWNKLKASSVGGERAVFIGVSAGLLSPGVQYEVTLSGVAGSSRVEDLGYYYFNLVKN